MYWVLRQTDVHKVSHLGVESVLAGNEEGHLCRFVVATDNLQVEFLKSSGPLPFGMDCQHWTRGGVVLLPRVRVCFFLDS